MTQINSVEAVPARIPLRRPHHMSFGAVDAVDVVFARVSAGAYTGWGEATLLGGPGWSEETPESVEAAIRRYLAPVLMGEDPRRITLLAASLEKRARGNPFAKAALEMALFDLVGKMHRVSVYQLLGGLFRERVRVSWSLASSSVEDDVAEARRKIEEGFTLFKIKLGVDGAEAEEARVARIREGVGPAVTLRIDANQGWDRMVARRMVADLPRHGIELVEQPLPAWDVEGLCMLRRGGGVPLMADESVRTRQDALLLVQRGAADAFSLKLTKAGGFLETLAIAAVAHGACVPCYMGCMIETSLGTAAYLHAACAIPAVTLGCELFGPLLLEGDVSKVGLVYRDGYIMAPEGPGLGVEPDGAMLARYAL